MKAPSIVIRLSYLTLLITSLFFSCSRSRHSVKVDDSKNQPIVAQSIRGQIYQTLNNDKRIVFISSDELEIQDRDGNIVCKYTIQDKILRVVTNELGVTQALYFKLIPEGIIDNRNLIFYSPNALKAAVEAARLAQEKAAEQQRLELQRQEQNRIRISNLTSESKIATKIILESQEPAILNKSYGNYYYSIIKTVITDVGVTFSTDQLWVTWSQVKPQNSPNNFTYWFGDLDDFQLYPDQTVGFRGEMLNGPIWYLTKKGVDRLFFPKTEIPSFVQSLKQAFQSWKSKYADIQVQN